MKHMEKLAANNTTDCLWPYILSIIKEKPCHAYILRKAIRERFGFTPGTVTAYRVLYSLRKEGLVSIKRKGRKRVYTITPEGRKALMEAKEYYRKIVSFL